MKTKDPRDDPDETQPYPEALLDERWEWGPPVAGVKAKPAAEADEAAPDEPAEVIEAEAGTKRQLIEEIAAFLESRASDPAEGERLARDLRSAFAGAAETEVDDSEAEDSAAE